MEQGKVCVCMSSASYFQKLPVEEAVIELPARGICDAELFLNSFTEYEPDFADLLAERILHSGLRVHAVHPMSTQFEPQMLSIHPRQFNDSVRMFEKVLSAGKKLGATLYVMHSSPRFNGILRNVNMDRIAPMFREFALIAAGYGITLALENVSWCMFSEPDFGKELVDRIGDSIHFTLDIKQCFRSGYTPDDYIDAVGPLIRNVHLCDFVHAEDGSFKWVLPGKGEYRFSDLFRKLKSLGYNGPLTVEVYSDSYRSFPELYSSYFNMQKIVESIFDM